MATVFENGSRQLYELLKRLNATQLDMKEIRQPWADASIIMISYELPTGWTKEQVIKLYNQAQGYTNYPQPIIG